MNHKLTTLESMMLFHLRTKTGQDKLQTMLSAADLRQIGLREFQGRYTHQVRHEDQWKTFEILPRSA